MMRTVEVVKSFDYAADGFTIKTLAIGDILTMQKNIADGLAAAGLVKAASDGAKQAVKPENKQLPGAPENKDGGGETPPVVLVEIPAAYDKLGWKALKALAVSLGAVEDLSKGDVLAFIEAEVVKRADAVKAAEAAAAQPAA